MAKLIRYTLPVNLITMIRRFFTFFFSQTLIVATLYASQQQVVDRVINQSMQKNDIPGVAVAVFCKNKGSIYCYGFADLQIQAAVTSETIFEIASITKVFTSTDLALQVNEGRMNLADPITKYLPRLQQLNAPIHQVTLEQLATHSSSLPRSLPMRAKNRQVVIEFLEHWEPLYPIGTRYLYSNLAFGLLGYALENTEHKPYEQLIQSDILQPLGMTSTEIHVPKELESHFAQGYFPDGAPAPRTTFAALQAGGALCSTASDMLLFLRANLAVGKQSKLIQAMQLAQRSYFRVNEHLTMGLGWQRFTTDDLLIIDKNGGLAGFSSYIGMIPEKKIGVVILFNTSKVQSTQIGRRLLKRFAASSEDSTACVWCDLLAKRLYGTLDNTTPCHRLFATFPEPAARAQAGMIQ